MTNRRILFGGAVAVALGATAAMGGQTSLNAATFDAAAWKAQKGKHTGENPRVAMFKEVDGLLKSGMSRTEIETLLGPPDELYRQFLYGVVDGGDPKTSKTITFDAAGKVIPQSQNLKKDLSGTGMTPNQVKAVMGEPKAERFEYTYYLGSPGMAPDPEYLQVLFDGEGRLIRHSRTSG